MKLQILLALQKMAKLQLKRGQPKTTKSLVHMSNKLWSGLYWIQNNLKVGIESFVIFWKPESEFRTTLEKLFEICQEFQLQGLFKRTHLPKAHVTVWQNSRWHWWSKECIECLEKENMTSLRSTTKSSEVCKGLQWRQDGFFSFPDSWNNKEGPRRCV